MDGYRPETYGDRWAEIYDQQYGDVSDVDGTVQTIRALAGDRSVLELGIGTGRLALPLVAAGVRVVGVDASSAMLRQLASKPADVSPDAVRAEMDTLPFRARCGFGVVFAAFNTFFNLTTIADQQRCLGEIASVLEPDGHLVIEAFVPGPEPDRPEHDVTAPVVELDRVVLSVTARDPSTRTITGQRVELTESGTVFRPWMICYASPAELDSMAAEAGFELENRWGGWRNEPLTTGCDRHVSVYRLRAR